jgi:transposase
MRIKPLDEPVQYKKELDFIRQKHKSPITYCQDWTAYNQTQTSEFAMFQNILIELLDSLIETKTPIRQGRPFNDFKEMVFCCIMRSYYGKSSRRSVSFLDYAIAKGYIRKKPHFNTILNYYKYQSITPILKYLIENSGFPLKDFKLDFAVDSSGFSTSLFGRWLDIRIQSPGMKRIWKKAHVTSGVKTNIITAIEITPGFFADSPQFKDLVKITSKTFKIREISADKAYSARKNLQVVTELGGVPYIPFKVNASGKSGGTIIWGLMKKFYDNHREYFMDHYHKRSNAESVFSMIKRKFGHKLYSKSEVGQVNEILCKALAYNICVLIQEYYEMDIKFNFDKCAKQRVAR